MSDDRTAIGVWLCVFALVMIQIAIINATVKISSAISRSTTVYLCIEAAKLGTHAPDCDELTGKEKP